MLCTTKAIVLKSLKYSETSLISKIYTEKYGLKTFLIRGVRKKNSKISPLILQPLSLIELVFTHKEKNQLLIPREISTNHSFKSLYTDVKKSAQALFISELVYRSIREEVANPELFEYLTKSILLLDLSDNASSNLHIAISLHLTRFLGFAPLGSFSPQTPYFILKDGIYSKYKPDNNDEYLEPPLSEIFDTLMKKDIVESSQLNLSYMKRQKLLEKIILYYQLHLIGLSEIHSFDVLSMVFHT